MANENLPTEQNTMPAQQLLSRTFGYSFILLSMQYLSLRANACNVVNLCNVWRNDKKGRKLEFVQKKTEITASTAVFMANNTKSPGE